MGVFIGLLFVALSVAMYFLFDEVANHIGRLEAIERELEALKERLGEEDVVLAEEDGW